MPREGAHLQRISCTLHNLFHMIIHPLDTFIKHGFVVTIQVGQMDLDPAKPAQTKGLCVRELEQATGKVISDVIEVRWDRIGATSEVEIMREVERIAQELGFKNESRRLKEKGKLTALAISIL